jgi:hypothetical protein
MTSTDEILDSIESRLRELKAEIDTLNAAREALDGREEAPPKPPSDRNAPAAASSSPTRKPQRRARRRARRTAEAVPAGKLELLLSETEGLSTSALVARAGGHRDQVLILLRELEAAGRIRRTGQRRSTRWHAITDEDRIRERAAELELRRKSAA